MCSNNLAVLFEISFLILIINVFFHQRQRYRQRTDAMTAEQKLAVENGICTHTLNYKK